MFLPLEARSQWQNGGGVGDTRPGGLEVQGRLAGRARLKGEQSYPRGQGVPDGVYNSTGDAWREVCLPQWA